MDKKTSSIPQKPFRTLLTSVLLSSTGPVVLGIGLIYGHSSTQIADFTRRTAELVALIVALVVFCITERGHGMDLIHRERVRKRGNTFVGGIMCLSGLLMISVLFILGQSDKGNVIPACSIAFMGVIVNSIFFFRYTKMYRTTGNSILKVQGRLYGAKSLVDICVTLSLFMIIILPQSKIAHYFDSIGTIVVASYLVFCGLRTIKENWLK